MWKDLRCMFRYCDSTLDTLSATLRRAGLWTWTRTRPLPCTDGATETFVQWLPRSQCNASCKLSTLQLHV